MEVDLSRSAFQCQGAGCHPPLVLSAVASSVCRSQIGLVWCAAFWHGAMIIVVCIEVMLLDGWVLSAVSGWLCLAVALHI